MRRNFFQLINETNSISKDAERIIDLFEVFSTIYYEGNNYSLNVFFDKFCFQDWGNKGHFIDLDDLLEQINFENIKYHASADPVEEDALFILIELIYNLWAFSRIQIDRLINAGFDCSTNTKFDLLETIMTDVVEQYNQIISYHAENSQYIITENKPEVTAVAETIKEDLVIPVIKYNHRSLRGDLDKKRSILNSLYHELEPKRQLIKDFNNKLEENIFYLCNNLDIRHNNVDEGHTKYKEYVANMDEDTLEGWYDELYQMMLLAFLAIDDIENRRQKVNKLKRDIEGE